MPYHSTTPPSYCTTPHHFTLQVLPHHSATLHHPTSLHIPPRCPPTARYMAPEVFAETDQQRAIANYSRQADIWSLGMVLFYVFENQTPFIHPIAVKRASWRDPPPTHTHTPHLSTALPHHHDRQTAAAVATAAVVRPLRRCSPLSCHMSPLQFPSLLYTPAPIRRLQPHLFIPSRTLSRAPAINSGTNESRRALRSVSAREAPFLHQIVIGGA